MTFSCCCGLTVLGQNSAPPTPDKPWRPSQLGAYEAELAALGASGKRDAARVGIEPRTVYDLPELIDLAERNHPETRVAWERARQAAAAVGLSQSAYYPYLVASAAAGYERVFVAFPSLGVNEQKLLTQVAQALPVLLQNPASASQLGTRDARVPNVSILGGGTLTTEAFASRNALSMKWLLFDFGAREAVVASARERLMMANVGFNATHQRVVFEVTRLFYEYQVARQKVAVATSARQSAGTTLEAARARCEHGLATQPEVLQAEQQAAQTDFDLEAAQGALDNAQIALEESLGVTPTGRLQVAVIPPRASVEKFETSLDELIERALSQRPDLVARLADVHARRDEVRRVRADGYYPKIVLSGHAGYDALDVSVGGSKSFGGSEPVYGVGVAVEVPIFDGFARDNKLRIAESELRAAESELAGARDAVVRDVWKAYTDFKTALHRQEAADRLLAAAESASAASLDAYRHGLGSYVDVVSTARNVTAARGANVDTRAAIFTRAAALALSIGELARPQPSARTPPPGKK